MKHAPTTTDRRARLGILLGSGIVGIMVGAGIVSTHATHNIVAVEPTVTATATATTTATATATVEAATAIPGEGFYQVGVDVKPGTYVSKAPDSGRCYWARIDKGGNRIDSKVSAGQSIVTIRKTDSLFQTTGCNKWTRRK